MMKLFRKSEKGFSLVELMIVVAIIAILAAIAIPAFMRFAMKSKTSEAMGNMSAIRTCLEAYRAENDIYLACALSPRDTPDSKTFAWVDRGDSAAAPSPTDWASIGFEPDGAVRYTYLTTTSLLDGNTYTIVAEGDLDDANGVSTYTVTKGENKPVHSNDDF